MMNKEERVLSALSDLANGALNYYQASQTVMAIEHLIREYIEDLQQKIDKAIEYMNSEEFFMKMNSNSIQPPADKYVCQDYFEAKEKLVEILGDKQCQ